MTVFTINNKTHRVRKTAAFCYHSFIFLCYMIYISSLWLLTTSRLCLILPCNKPPDLWYCLSFTKNAITFSYWMSLYMLFLLLYKSSFRTPIENFSQKYFIVLPKVISLYMVCWFYFFRVTLVFITLCWDNRFHYLYLLVHMCSLPKRLC